MKHTALPQDDRALWDDVTKCLRDVNAKKLSPFGAEWTPEDVSDNHQDTTGRR